MSPAAPGPGTPAAAETPRVSRAKAVRHTIEYGIFRALMWLIESVPLRVSEALVRGLADTAFALGRNRRRIAIDNILQCGITADPREAAAIARRSFRNFALLILESFRADRMLDGDNWRQHVDVRIDPEAQAILDAPARGVIVATGHLGSWEMAARAVSHSKPVAGVARRMNNPKVEAWLQRRKSNAAFYQIPKYDKRNLGRFLSILKQGHVLAIMIDQHASWGGVRVPFFGRPAYTYTTLPLLHLVTGAPLCFGYCRRIGPLRYEVRVEGPIRCKRTGNKEEDIRKILEDVSRRLENAIRQSPDQYLWGHRRWKEQQHRLAQDPLPAAPGGTPTHAPGPPPPSEEAPSGTASRRGDIAGGTGNPG